ncbi:hypothetical protein [Polynucleobacter sp. MWH-UH23A]|uniref:hypothetical protein n=1 Tax=Polynucleobacter sp. MWH-UH23A TaxID=1855613 RepID=UPI00336509CD
MLRLSNLMNAVLFTLLLNAASQASANCYKDSILSPTPFMGNNDEIFKLASGGIWQVKYEYEYLYEYYPNVVICPSAGKLLINGKKLNVQQVSSGGSTRPSGDIIESSINGEFKGWEGESIYALMNGQVWQQATYYYYYHYAYAPKVLIYQNGGAFFMQVQGVKQAVQVRRLR